MSSSARLDKETAALLKKAAEYTGSTQSELMRKSIRAYCTRIVVKQAQTPWEIFQLVHVAGGSGHGKRLDKGVGSLKKKFDVTRKAW